MLLLLTKTVMIYLRDYGGFLGMFNRIVNIKSFITKLHVIVILFVNEIIIVNVHD